MAKNESGFQPGLWQDETHDPEKKLFRLGRSLGDPFYRHQKHTPIKEEIGRKKSELRKRIGLPVARGKDPHVNDDFYKFLVKKVYKFDEFGIFLEYDRVLDEVPPELDLQINQVRGLVGELLNKGLNGSQRFRFRKFKQFVQEYQERWKD